MKHGNWVPISKAFTRHLPKDRPYTKLEAAFSMQVDYDIGNAVTIRGYADLCQWSVGKVYRFLDQMGVKILYPGDTIRKQNQRGTIMNTITERKENEKGMIRFIDSKGLQDKAKRKRNDDEHDNGTIIERYYKSLNPNPKKYKYSKKVAIPSDFSLTDEMKAYAKQERFDIDLDAFTDNFILKCQAHGYKYKDWVAAWKNWLKGEMNHANKGLGKTRKSTKYAGIGKVLST